MAKEEVLSIISQGESFTVEFKGEEKFPLSDYELYKTVVCLANGNGGLLLIGVEDDGRTNPTGTDGTPVCSGTRKDKKRRNRRTL